MGKGYNNFMCKKPFHPGSRENIKRVWMAEQRAEDEKKKQEELRIQYEKEQELYNNRLLVSTESKEKLSLNFMYEAPKGVKERVKEDDEPEYKFEWQRHAPRESFAKNNMDIRDQPFGIQVRNVRCIKCHKWGHLNTDRECPEFNQSVSLIPGGSKLNQDELLQAMHEDGLALKKTLNGEKFDPRELVVQKQEEDPEMVFLRSLTKHQKEKLLRKLNKLSGVASKTKKENKKSKRHQKSSSGSDSDESSPDRKKSKSHRNKHSKKHHKKDKAKRESRSRSSSDSPRKLAPKIEKIKSEPESDTERFKDSVKVASKRSRSRSRSLSRRIDSPVRRSIKSEFNDKNKYDDNRRIKRRSPERSYSRPRKYSKDLDNVDKRKDIESKSVDSFRHRRSRSSSTSITKRRRNQSRSASPRNTRRRVSRSRSRSASIRRDRMIRSRSPVKRRRSRSITRSPIRRERNYRQKSPKFDRREGEKRMQSRSKSRERSRERSGGRQYDSNYRKGKLNRDDRRRDR